MGLGLKVQGLGFGFRVEGSGFGVSGLGLSVFIRETAWRLSDAVGIQVSPRTPSFSNCLAEGSVRRHAHDGAVLAGSRHCQTTGRSLRLQDFGLWLSSLRLRLGEVRAACCEGWCPACSGCHEKFSTSPAKQS